MSTSATIIIEEDERLPIVLYCTLGGEIASFSEKYGRAAGTGCELLSMVNRYTQKKAGASAETAANEFLLLSEGSCRITDCIHDDIEYLYTLKIKNDPQTGLRLFSLLAYEVALWNFARDRSNPVWKIQTWLADKVPSAYFTHKYFIRQIDSQVKKASAPSGS